MTHDELLELLDGRANSNDVGFHEAQTIKALRAVVELHKPIKVMRFMSDSQSTLVCPECSRPQVGMNTEYPCPTIQAIEKELK